MSISRLLTLAAAVVSLSAASPVLLAEQQNVRQNRQEKRKANEQRDIDALIQLVDAVSAGKQPAPTDIPVTWASNHFVKGGDATTYVPFTIALDRSKLNSEDVAIYVRVAARQNLTPAEQEIAARARQRPTYAWTNIHFVEVPSNGQVARAMSLPAGTYDLFIAVKDASPEKPPRNAQPAKFGLLQREVTIPDYMVPELSTSSIIVASTIESLSSPLKEEQQQENPYTFGTMKVVPSADGKMKKSGELQVLFWIYGMQHTSGKPDVSVEYNFHQKTAEGEKYFNKTAPQTLNASTLPPQFDVAAGHQLPGSLVVPLASFPEGEYRLEIKITDKTSGKTLTQNAAFTVEA